VSASTNNADENSNTPTTTARQEAAFQVESDLAAFGQKMAVRSVFFGFVEGGSKSILI
jgi:hypothetical protein